MKNMAEHADELLRQLYKLRAAPDSTGPVLSRPCQSLVMLKLIVNRTVKLGLLSLLLLALEGCYCLKYYWFTDIHTHYQLIIYRRSLRP